MLQIELLNFNAVNYASGSILPLGWRQDGTISFEISGRSGSYRTSYFKAETWMQENLELLGNVALKNMCIVGTHRAGMGVFN